MYQSILKCFASLALLVGCAVFCGGCCDCKPPELPPPPAPPPYVPLVNSYTTAGQANAAGIVNVAAEVLDAQFAQLLQLRTFRLGRSNDGLPSASVEVKNATAVPLRIKYRFDWLDATGAVVDDIDRRGWEKATINGTQDFTLKSLAPEKKCVAYKMSIKYILPEAE